MTSLRQFCGEEQAFYTRKAVFRGFAVKVKTFFPSVNLCVRRKKARNGMLQPVNWKSGVALPILP